MEQKKEVIRIEHLQKQFSVDNGFFSKGKRTVKAVNDVSLTLNKGEILGLVGESGSGKTTLARLILKLTRATQGSVTIDGIDMSRASAAEVKLLRQRIAVVFQDPASNLNPRETVMSSIMRPMILHGTPKKEAREKAREALRSVKMDEHYLNSYPHQLSGGQLQRIAIARALAIDPEIMILDEPTSALDVSVQAQILNLLLDLQEQRQLTYLVITHDLNVIRYISDRVAVMYLGKLVEYGPTELMCSHPSHPYTRALMAASPILDPKLRNREKHVMKGDPGSLIDLPSGCHFHPRCPCAQEECLREEPEMLRLTEDHWVCCRLCGGEGDAASV